MRTEKLKQTDIAVVEMLHDRLLDSKTISIDSALHRDYKTLISRMRELIKEDHYLETRTILEEANDIIFIRSEDKQRQYGPIDESLADTATVASIMANKTITTDDVYKVLIALKIARLKHNSKHDTYLDCIGYLAANETYVNKNPIDKVLNEFNDIKFPKHEK